MEHFVGHPPGLQFAWNLYEVKHSSAAKEIQKIKFKYYSKAQTDRPSTSLTFRRRLQLKVVSLGWGSSRNMIKRSFDERYLAITTCQNNSRRAGAVIFVVDEER